MDVDLTEKGLHNGQVVLVLSSGSCQLSCGFDMDLLAGRLEGLGIQLCPHTYKRSIEKALMDSRVRRYILFNSRAFRLAFAVMFYLAVWGNIYSTFRQLSVSSLSYCLCVSLSAASFTLIIILLFHRQDKKINVNTDVRLAAVNEILMGHNLLAGITDSVYGFRNVVHLSLVYFNSRQCREGLLAWLERNKNHESFQAELREQLDSLRVVVELTAARQPERRPLISSGSSDDNSAVTQSAVADCLIAPGNSAEMTHQLLVVYSPVYARLLVTGQLPPTSPSPHAPHIASPCLCRFIQSVLNLGTQSEEP